MTKFLIRIDQSLYDVSSASENSRKLVTALQNIDQRTVHKQNEMATLRRAKHAYLTDLRAEIVKKKSGVDLSALLDGE